MKSKFEWNWEFEELLETLENGRSQKFEEFIIARLKNGRVEVRGYLPYHTIDEIPIDSIKNELQKVKENFIQLMNKSQLLKDFVLKVGIDYSLDLDYGGGSILICAEKEEVYKVYLVKP
jgi:hypothetical protein